MELKAIDGAIDMIRLMQIENIVEIKDAICKLVGAIEEAAGKLLTLGNASELKQKTILIELQTRVDEIGPLNKIGPIQKNLCLALSECGKLIHRLFTKDIAKAYRQVDSDAPIINRIVASHFYKKGMFELGDVFVQESQVPAAIRDPFLELHDIIEAMKHWDLTPAIAWATSHHQQLLQMSSSLEFRLHQLQFVRYIQLGLRFLASNYVQEKFPAFASHYMLEICYLWGSLSFCDRLHGSPYSHFSSPTYWRPFVSEFKRAYYDLLGESPVCHLHLALSAGFQALPSLLKMVILIRSMNQEWLSLTQLPAEIELSEGLQFHTIFVCPVCKEESTDENPPMFMRCDHVLCRNSLRNLLIRGVIDCPFCDVRMHLRDCRQLYF